MEILTYIFIKEYKQVVKIFKCLKIDMFKIKLVYTSPYSLRTVLRYA